MIRNPRDFYAGLLFIAFGVVALMIVQAYAIGTVELTVPTFLPDQYGIKAALFPLSSWLPE